MESKRITKHIDRFLLDPNNYRFIDYVRHKNFKVALTHASLNKKPVREVHGGCTPEEILVPFILISNKKEDVKRVSTNNTVKQNTPQETTPKQTAGFEEEDLF